MAECVLLASAIPESLLFVSVVNRVISFVHSKTTLFNIFQDDSQTEGKKKPSNLKDCWVFVVEVTGFEPATFWSRTKRATKLRYTSKYGANEGTRTLDLLITNQLLYRLSHIGVGFTVPAIT